MKNVAIAIGILAVVMVLAFVFVKGDHKNGDTFIPSPVTVASPQLQFRQGSSSAMENQAPFQLLKPEEIDGKKIRITTAKGDIVFELYGDAPIAASNFIALTQKGFYNGLTFHRREEGFVIQGGDPNGNGTGGPNYRFPDEPVAREYDRGIVAMANSGPNTNGSQFFIMLKDNSSLPKNYTIFGKVVEGLDVVDKIAVGDKMTKVTVE